ncbi:MAG TPA: tetratricopeptide repeat protein [Chloroflexota bacterium]|nr:tetratricopeptide repeat protein [Chloroflexota bacterium]
MLQIHLFGHLRLLVDGQPYRFHTLPKTPLLLAYLLLHRDTAVPRDHLAYLLWDDVPESEARANLRRHLHDLRRALPAATDWVFSDAKSVQWHPAAPTWLDVAEFERLSQDTGRLAEAITLYTGDLLQELYDDWLIPHRERLRGLYFTAVTRLMERERSQGDLTQAMIYARQLLHHDPLREDVVRSLILMRHESGDRAGAMQIYHQFAARLDEELGVSPMPETAAIYEAIAANTPIPVSAAAPHAAAPSPDRSAGPSSSPPSAAQPAPAAAPHNLPARLTSFVGREQEMSQVGRFLSGSTRLLTITGPGGSGKTRLALEVAHSLWQNQPDAFPQGVFFVGLAAVNNPEFVVTAVAETLGVRETPGQPGLPGLINHLRPQRLLLVLDNFEHLMPAAAAVSDLLTAVPGLRLLVTSQIPLHLYGEQEFPLAPLPLPALDQLPPPAELLQFAAIALFVERFQAVRPDFELTAENAAAIAQICHYLDGIPLALELAAARGKLFTPAAMLTQLSQRLRFLSSQARNLPTRHQTLRAAIDWSYNLLEPVEQQLFARLALFATSFTEEAAMAICPGLQAEPTAVLETLYSLVDKSILRALAEDDPDGPRFRMLQTLREYGLEKLSHHPAAMEIHYNYAVYCTTLAQQAETELRYGDQAAALRCLRREDLNIMAALEWLVANLDNPENGRLAAQLVSAQERFWSLQGRFSEAGGWLSRVLPLAYLLPLDEQIKLYNRAGVIAQQQGDYATAATHHAAALTLARENEEPLPLAHTLHYLGFAAGRQGHYEEARQLLEESLAIYRQSPEDNLASVTTLLNNLSIVYRRMGKLDKAIAVLTEALALKRERNDKIGLPAVLGNLGQLVADQGDLAQAEAYVREGLLIRIELQDQPGLLISIEQMADLLWQRGQTATAVTLLAATTRQRREINQPLTTHVQQERDEGLAQMRAVLGNAVFNDAWATGEQMALDTAVQVTLNASA